MSRQRTPRRLNIKQLAAFADTTAEFGETEASASTNSPSLSVALAVLVVVVVAAPEGFVACDQSP